MNPLPGAFGTRRRSAMLDSALGRRHTCHMADTGSDSQLDEQGHRRTPKPSKRSLSIAAVVLMLTSIFGLFGLSLGTAGAQAYPPPSTEVVTPDKPDAPPGSTVELTATGFQPGSPVTFYINGSPIGTATAGPDGVARINWLIPAGTPAGPVEIKASGLDSSGNPVEVFSTFRVDSEGGLPFTGSDAGSLVRIAVVLLVVGAIAATVARRRSDGRSGGNRRHPDAERLTV